MSEATPCQFVRHGFEYIGIPREVAEEIRHSGALAIYTHLVLKGSTWQPRPKEIREHFQDMGRPRYDQSWKILKELKLAWTTQVRVGGRIVDNILNFSPVPLSDSEIASINAMQEMFAAKNDQADLRFRANMQDLLHAAKNGDLFESGENTGKQDTESQKADIQKNTGSQDTESQKSNIRSKAPENAGSTESQDSENQKCDVLVSKYIYLIKGLTPKKNPFADPLPASHKIRITHEWKPDIELAEELAPGYPLEFITKMTATWLEYRLANEHREKQRRTIREWMTTFAKHLEKNWEVHGDKYGKPETPEFERLGFASPEAMQKAQDAAGDLKMAEQFAKDLRKKREKGDDAPIPPHLAHLIDSQTLEVRRP